MTSTGFINAVEYYERPSGSLLMGADNYHHLFKKREHNIFKKHHPSVYHKEGELAPEMKRRFYQHHTSVTNDLNNNMNFNPTKETTYFEEHETNKHLHYPNTKPRYEIFNFRDTVSIDKIDDWKKDGNHPHTRLEHSNSLKVRSV